MKVLRLLAAMFVCCLMLGWVSPAAADVHYYDTNVRKDKAGDASGLDYYKQSIDVRKVTYAHVFINGVPYLQARVRMKDVKRYRNEGQAIQFVWWWTDKNGVAQGRTLWGYNNGATDYRNGSAFRKCPACKSIANISANTMTLRIPYARFGKPSNISGMRVTSFRMDGTVKNWTNAGQDGTRNSGVLY